MEKHKIIYLHRYLNVNEFIVASFEYMRYVVIHVKILARKRKRWRVAFPFNGTQKDLSKHLRPFLLHSARTESLVRDPYPGCERR